MNVPRPRQFTNTFTLALAIWLFACGESTNGNVESSSEIVFGDTILVIGANDEVSGHDLYQIRAATLLPDGNLIIADGGSGELREVVERFGAGTLALFEAER
jgi:hypothetical protein